MKSVNDLFYICKKGHITVGNSNAKKKCDQKIRTVRLAKVGKSKTEKETVKEEPCNEELVSIKEIPKELKLFEKWDSTILEAFMIDQPSKNLRLGFIDCLQRHFISLHKKISELESIIKNTKKE